MLPPSHRIGYGRYSLSFRERRFSETQNVEQQRRTGVWWSRPFFAVAW